MKVRLPETISSPQDLAALILEMRSYASWFRHEDIKKRVSPKHASPPPALSRAATDLIRDLEAKKIHTAAGLDQLISQLESYKKTAPSLIITLPAPPPGSLKTTLVEWCRDTIAPNVMVSFRFNSTILGGMIVQCGSRVFDWSFRRQLLAARDDFPEVLRRV